MIKLLIGGSPCTHWSIAQSKNRETKAEGLGWELFLNFVIAKEKFKPDFFLYENNWSASKEIKDQIQKELDCELMRINSKLVSAQNRDRFYVFNWDVKQPEDRGILLQNILESGIAYLNKCQCLTATYSKQTVSEAQFAHSLDKKMRTMVAMPFNRNTNQCFGVAYRSRYENGKNTKRFEGGSENKSNCLTTVQTDSMVAYPVEEAYLTENMPIYKVENGLISIKDKLYPIKLGNGYYIIRKLTPIECERLQTLPDNYTAAVSNTQRYKGLGNGWTAEVIIHVLQGALKDVPKNEKIIVLSMYDGIATGRYCLDKMGFTNVEYYSYEIDKYAIKVATSNYPDIIQHGDAFQVRNENWRI